MDFDFSIADSPAAVPSVALRTVYMVHADPSYHVKKHLPETRDWVALRTLSGKGRVRLEGGCEFPVTPGTLLLFEHGKVRQYNCSDESWGFWWFEFLPFSPLSLPLNTLLHPLPFVTEEADFRECLASLKQSTPTGNAAASSVLSRLLHCWMASLSAGQAGGHPHRTAVEKVIAHIRSSPASHITIREMAGMTGLCERRFREVFEIITGLQPKKYVTSIRLEMATELLRNTPFSLAEIADRFGYSSPFHFSREFSKVYGVSPTAFRHNRKG